ncbi:glyoxalase [Caulobacter segnis]|uniref:Glyoxalase/bleomycin resistance protein/dioxygenase n=2 Tax=Caulobacter segnis TaxID=88688 RepID=D5VG09_CAUST|nr:VOC family protein [Caulobacter segnis]ADG10012.1 Glyoxalase/bleomycin resistance protein/dioxygenase [Caulobacter segnis ATCC 21756]AVQ01768.1 glyoxalase [Caulobacter segnis]
MPRPGLISALAYDDPKAAVAWLEKAFGFEVALLVEDDEGRLAHCEMTYGESTIMIGSPWHERIASPGMVGGKTTQTVHIQLGADVDAHCARARAAGAEIFAEPEDQFYGDRTYRCYDLEGHIWTVSAPVEAVSIAEMEARSGHKITTPSA